VKPVHVLILAAATALLGFVGGMFGARYQPSWLREHHALEDERIQEFEALRDGVDLEEAMRRALAKQARKRDGPKSASDIISMTEIQRNETTAVVAARDLVSAQAMLQASGKIDGNADGVGEFGGFLELSGATRARMIRRLHPPALGSCFKRLEANGELDLSGYYYRIYLPDKRGAGVGEPAGGFTRASGVDSTRAERIWCLYAWPKTYGVTGKRTFCINQSGESLWTDDRRYSGAGGGPEPGAAFRIPGISGRIAGGIKGLDGNRWQPGL
jgi:hypothetical protein